MASLCRQVHQAALHGFDVGEQRAGNDQLIDAGQPRGDKWFVHMHLQRVEGVSLAGGGVVKVGVIQRLFQPDMVRRFYMTFQGAAQCRCLHLQLRDHHAEVATIGIAFAFAVQQGVSDQGNVLVRQPLAAHRTCNGSS